MATVPTNDTLVYGGLPIEVGVRLDKDSGDYCWFLSLGGREYVDEVGLGYRSPEGCLDGALSFLVGRIFS